MSVYGYEVTNDYTEVDPGLPAILTLAGSRFTYQLLTDTDGLYAYRDFGVGKFSDDFEIRFSWIMTANSLDATYPYRVMLCSLVNDLEDWKVNTDASKVQIGVTHYTSVDTHYLAPVKSISDSTSKGTGIEVEYNTTYYIKLIRSNETTLTLYVYSDSTFTTLVGSSELTIGATDYRYLMPIQNYDYAEGSVASTGYIENVSVNLYPELVGWAKALTEIENRILDYIKAIDNDDFSFNDTNCGTRVIDAEEYPICRLLFINDKPEFVSYELTSRTYYFLLTVETYINEDVFDDATATRDWLLQKRLVGAIVDMLDTYREDNPYWSLLTYEVNKDLDEEETIYDTGTMKIYLTVVHES